MLFLNSADVLISNSVGFQGIGLQSP